MNFCDWLKAIFAHPVSGVNSHLDIVFDEPEDDICLSYITQLFSAPEQLEEYLDEQANQGLNFIIDPSSSNHIFALYNHKISLAQRLECIASFESLFKNYFAKHCTDTLSHLDEQHSNVLNRVCYMWWDIIALYGHPEDSKKRALDQPILDLMKKILSLESIACQESAIHGLGHWHMYYPKQVEEILDDYLSKPRKRNELQSYARQARTGCIN